MAKRGRIKNLPVEDRTYWWQSLAYMPTDYKKSRLWMAQSLFFAKLNSQVLQERTKALSYRRTDVLQLDTQYYKNLIDPPTPDDRTGGQATYFSADFKAMPIDVHLDNIVEAGIRTIPRNITCSLADPIAKLQEQKDKEKIIAQGMVRNIINDFAKELGFPKISESTDPYRWIQNFTSKEGEQKVDEVGDAIDQIRTRIKDDYNLRLFQNYLYKNGLEVAFEVGIKYYLLDQNQWQIKHSSRFLKDLKNFNKASGSWVIDETTGQGIVDYIDPTTLYTSPFEDRNGDDILYWFYEKNVTFAEYERLLGTTMTDDQKSSVLKLQKQQGWQTGTSFANNSNKNNSQIRIGKFSLLTQEANAFSEKYINDRDDGAIWYNKPLSWQPDPDSDETKRVKVYNVWYSCYYIPLTIFEYQNNSPNDWAEQSKYIFSIQKDIDMMRYGVDSRYAKSSLVVYKNDTQPSWTDIKESFMPKIHTLWHKFQNCVVQDTQGLAIDYDLLGGMLNAVDDANKEEPTSGGEKIVQEWKMLRQAGMAWLKFRDKNGQLMIQDPSKLFVPIDSGHMKKGEMYLLQIMNLYNIMTQALARGQASEGVQPQPRTALGGIEIANEAANKATYFLEESYIDGIIVPFAMRCASHIHKICKEKKAYNYAERWKQFNDVVGRYNGAVIEGIEDIQFGNIGLTIANRDDSAKKEIIIQNIVQRFANKQITTQAMGLLLATDMWKLQLVELALEEQRLEELAAQQAEAEHQRMMELKGMDLQIAQALTATKAQATDQNIITQAKMQAMLDAQLNSLKAGTMKEQKEQLLHNKLIQDENKARLDTEKKESEANIEINKDIQTSQTVAA